VGDEESSDPLLFNLAIFSFVASMMGKVKLSLYRPEQAFMVPGGWGFQISRLSAHKAGEVVSPKHRPLLPPRKYSWYSFMLEAESTPGPKYDGKDYVNEEFQ
jgi:hypothetical protein